MDLSNFEDLYGRLLDQELHSADSTVLFTSTRRSQAVNDGSLEFAALTECLIRTSTIACSCNTQTYNLLSSAVMSTDFTRLAARGVEYHLVSSGGSGSNTLTQLSGDGFPRRDIEWLNKYEPGWRTSTTPSMPTGYYVDEADGKYLIGLDHPPDIGSSETGTLLVPYVARPALMTSSGDVPYTVGSAVRTDLLPYHQAIVHYAAHQLEKLRGDDQASDRQLAKFQSYVMRFTEKWRKKGQNTVTFVKSYLRSASRRPNGDLGNEDLVRRWP